MTAEVYELPNDAAAERYVLAAAIESGGRSLATGGLREDDFHDGRHARLFAVLQRRALTGEPIEPPALLADVNGINGLDTAWLVKLLELRAVPASVGYYAEILRARSLARALIEAGTRVVGIGEKADDEATMLTLTNEASGLLTAAASRQTGSDDHAADLKAAVEELQGDVSYTPTPWHDLNWALGGFAPGRLYVAGGRPGTGKSLVGVCAALSAARNSHRAFIASVEMSKPELYWRMVANVGHVDHGRMMRRALDDDDWLKVTQAEAELAAMPIHVSDDLTTPSQIVARAHQIQRDHGPLGLLVVDYLQLMSGPAGSKANRQEIVAEFSRSLKLAAKSLHVPVLALSQLNRQADGQKPKLSDLRESGAIEQDADVVMLLHRDDDEMPGILTVAVPKNRHGSTGVIELAWVGYQQRIESLAKDGI